MRLTGRQSIGNRPLLLFGILLIFTGVQLVTLGLLAELQARTYHESQNKPTYVSAIRRDLASLTSIVTLRLDGVGSQIRILRPPSRRRQVSQPLSRLRCIGRFSAVGAHEAEVVLRLALR